MRTWRKGWRLWSDRVRRAASLIFRLLTRLVGEALARVICFAAVIVLLGLVVRLYVWVDSQVSGGINPILFAVAVLAVFAALYTWSLLRGINMDE